MKLTFEIIRELWGVLLDALFPHRLKLRVMTQDLERMTTLAKLRAEENLGLRRQLTDLLKTNGRNAAIHRRDQVAAHYQNLHLQAAEARLAGRPIPKELSDCVDSTKHVHIQEPLSPEPKPTPPRAP